MKKKVAGRRSQVAGKQSAVSSQRSATTANAQSAIRNPQYMTLCGFQRLIERQYLEKDRRRGLPGTFMWFAEEVGELAAALRDGSREEVAGEFADVLAWLSTLASLSGIELDEAAAKYAAGCPKCHRTPCACGEPKP